ncbi:MAG: tRNA pseudouridine(38-40) synthase TruA [Chlamydiae bacterium]|nr:tRNA pseudouridine(38-40) synthase TruA [Chlamydiota bacterium]
MPRYKLLIAYDGTSYGGWQSQPNSICIQDLLEKALTILTRQKSEVIGSGRTDAGVHALGQVAHFTTDEPIDTGRVLFSLNALLPKEIRALDLSQAPDTFHARFDATGKIYHYRIHLDPVLDPFKRKYALHVQQKINLDALKEAAKLFTGTRDFSSFANNQTKGSAAKDPVRTLRKLDVIEEEGGVRLEFEGTGFLYKMVRNITGTLLEVAEGKRAPEDISSILAAKDRSKAGKAAFPHGLFLVKVFYP